MTTEPQGTRHRRPLWRRLSLNAILVFTLPPFLALVWIGFGAIADYRGAQRFDDWWSHSAHVHRFAAFRLEAGLKSFQASRIEREIDPHRDDVRSLRLRVDGSLFDDFSSDAVHRLGEDLDLELLRGPSAQEVRFRWRGDTSAHWTTPKKSFRIKTKRSELFLGHRTLAFTVKDVLPQYVTGRMAQDFGLLAPDTDVVPVFVNDRFYGIHRFVEPVDETFLRRHGRMPGNVYRADRAERGEVLGGQARGVFRGGWYWERVANNDRPGSHGTKAMGEFLEELWKGNPDERRLETWLDLDEISRCLAYLLICGDPYHMSSVHNQMWYEDPVTGLLHLIPWDVRLLDLMARPEPLNPFWCVALEDPELWTETLREIHRRYEDEEFLPGVLEDCEATYDRHRAAFEYDHLREGRIHSVGRPSDVRHALEANRATLTEWIGDARVAYAHEQPIDGYESQILDLVVEGRAPVLFEGFEFGGVLATDLGPHIMVPENASRGFDGNPPLHLVGELGTSANGRATLRFAEPIQLGARVDPGTPGMPPAGATYRFEIQGIATASDRPKLILRNAIDGSSVEVRELENGEALPEFELEAWPPPFFGTPDSTALTGEVHLTEDLVVPAGQALVLRAPLDLRLDPDVSILVRGQIQGTAAEGEVITIRRADPRKPWGVLALQGRGSAGSRLNGVTILGGGGALLERVEYKGMVCVHSTHDVRFSNCTFGENVRCDDAINAVYAGLDLLNCTIDGANADAIDYDASWGRISGCTITNSGNDGIDLMSCGPLIEDCLIEGSFDKGISIGEGADPWVVGTVIRNCNRGLEVKDGSEPWILSSRLNDCRVGLLQNSKNWRYGQGGWAKVFDTEFKDGDLDRDLGPTGRITDSLARSGASERVNLPERMWIVHRRATATESGPSRPAAPHDRLVPLIEFREDFRDPTAGFLGTESITRIDTHFDGLTVRARGQSEGTVAREFDRALGSEPTLVLEYSTEELGPIRVRARSLTGDVVELECPPTQGPRAFALASMELPWEHLASIEVDVEAPGGPGHLRLRRLSILEEGETGEDQ